MATTLRQITDRVDAILRVNVPGGTSVWRDRADAISREEAPGINQQWREAPVEAFSDDMDLHVLDIDLRIHVRAEPATPPAEDLHESVHGPITSDAQLKALAVSVRLTEQLIDPNDADETSAIKTARYRFKYLIPKTTL